MKIIETERLILRRWRQDDLKPFAQMNADPRVMDFFVSVQTESQTLAGIERVEAHIEKHGFGFWAAELKATNELIGFIGLKIVPENLVFAPAVEIGWRLGYDFWSKGLATEGARACLNFGFFKKKLPEIVSYAATGNFKSLNVMKKIRMLHTQDFEHPDIASSHPLRKHALYRISKLK